MLQLKHISITHTRDMRVMIDGLNLTLSRGDKAAIIGEEGDGKSSLLKLCVSAELIDGYAEYSGEVVLDGSDGQTGRAGYLPQEMADDVKARRICDHFAGVPGFLEADPRELSRTAQSLGLAPSFFTSERLIGTLSGGERVKLGLCALLFQQPDVYLLDEPSNDIDIETLEWLERFILSRSEPVLYISHDETLLERTANIIVHIERVRRKTAARHTVERLGYRQYIEKRGLLLENQERDAKKELSEYRKQQEKYRMIEQRVEHEQNVISRQDPAGGRLLKKKMKAVKSMGRRFERDFDDMTQMPDVEEAIFVRFDEDLQLPSAKRILELDLPELRAGDKLLAKSLKLSLYGREKLCIIGQNGCGKTTLLRHIADELLSRRDINAGYMPQNYEDLLDMKLNPAEFLSTGGHKDDMTRARTYLGSVKFTAEECDRKIAGLSGGQKAKLLLMKMVLCGCNVLILDEPTRNFSPLSNPVLRGVLRDYRGAIISVSHDRKYIAEVCERVVRLTPEGFAAR